MDFGVVLQTDPPASEVIRLMTEAERRGFSYGWTFDSCVLWQEPFVIHSQILANTRSMIAGPMVTNPGTRDWSVTASLFATLNDMFDNRTVCGIGRGDSAHRLVGKKPATLAVLADAMHVIRELAEGREAELNGTTVKIPWVRDGRLAPAYVGDDVAHQRDQLRWFGGMVGNHVADLVARYGESGPVPRELTDYIRAREGYDYSHHGRAGNASTDFVPDDIVDRFCLLGPPSSHVDRLRELEELGVDQFAIYLMHDAKEHTLAAYGDEIIAALCG
ncbi:MAG: LLM class flavin-dependent oxidoreductase [Haloechinothrix sp.]